MWTAVVGLTVATIVVLGSATLTVFGARRRGSRPALAVVAGIAFPLTWVLWYLRDEHPYRDAIRRT